MCLSLTDSLKFTICYICTSNIIITLRCTFRLQEIIHVDILGMLQFIKLTHIIIWYNIITCAHLQIWISFVCTALTTPATMLLIFLFKRTKAHDFQTPPCCAKTCCTCCGAIKRLWKRAFGQCCCCAKRAERKEYEERLQKKLLTDDVPHFSGFYLPWW